MYQVRRIKPGEENKALTLLFYDQGTDLSHIDNKVTSFRKLARQEGYDLTRQEVVLCSQNMVYSCFMVPNDGRTAFIFSSIPNESNHQEYEYSRQALIRLCQKAFDHDSNLLQVLLDPEDMRRRKICLSVGFRHLTDLIYLSRSTQGYAETSPPINSIHWMTYNPDQHELFKTIISQTYHDSLDCPELENLRDMEDIMRSHKSAGSFDGRWWNMLFYHNEPAGVILINPLRTSDSMELIYMGLIPQMRHKGLGQVLLHKAMDCSQHCQVSAIVLAVDYRNHPALQLYKNFGFSEFVQRSVLYYSRQWRETIISQREKIIEKPRRKKPSVKIQPLHP
ncbi:MAG: GNAT family N-acetyltransferase [Sedimentisphaerales bacterium]|nr:GNAT family N-acetyltransferase [Sedimentisphaerales bacterium]